MEVDSVLKQAGYSILDTHHYHNPTVLDLPCPAPKHVEKIHQLIEDNGLAPPSSYQLRGHNAGLDSCVNLLLSIEYQDSEIIFSGGIPAKSLTDALLEEPLNYKMIMKDPEIPEYLGKAAVPGMGKHMSQDRTRTLTSHSRLIQKAGRGELFALFDGMGSKGQAGADAAEVMCEMVTDYFRNFLCPRLIIWSW